MRALAHSRQVPATPLALAAFAATAAVAATPALAPARAAGRPAASAGVRVPHYAVNTYRIRIGIKGGETFAAQVDGVYTGDVVQESLSGSFSFDGTIKRAALFSGNVPRALGSGGVAYSPATVNGTWTASGAKWIDAPNKRSGPFTCTGTIGASVTPGQLSLAWKRSGSRLRFTLHAFQQELYENGMLDACPNGIQAGPVHGTEPSIYESTFSVPVSLIGQRSISRQVSGPLADRRRFFLQRCHSGGTCNVAWQGTVRFTRTKVVRVP